ncbi:hypothetical protein BLNAU_20391 [Blattamonas nauphoetae]|uniref:Uncharacterized protein n=1 Tax=Blattamonas nauphoetae TaxID=2049346 RepID=A0ABQ9WZF4_9EUKA|nr:hypothetical protein BLNAU_20391 [Blattamonas nauphoetae]
MPLCIPSQLSQSSLGNSISNSVGALQGTIMEDFNLGGTFLSKNTTFTHCESTPSPSLDIIVADRIDSEGFSFFTQIADTLRPPEQSYFYATIVNPISFTNCSFEHMSRDAEIENQNGLALCLQTPAPLTVTRCSFSDIRSNNGEGLAITTTDIQGQSPIIVFIEECTFSKCISDDTFTEVGGAALLFQAPGVSFSTFESTSAVKGGAFSGQTEYSIFFSNFQNNTAQTDPDWSLGSPCVVCGCTESVDDWTIDDSLIVVSDDGEGTNCTKDQPCGTLANALTKANEVKVFTINVCPGSFEPTTISSMSEMLTIRGHYPLDTVKNSSMMTTFALGIDFDASVTVKDFILSPLEGQRLVECRSTKTIILSALQIVNVHSVTVPLFDFSAGSISFEDSQLENITSTDCPLIKISTSAEFTMRAVLLRNIVSTHCAIWIMSGGKFTTTFCIFHRLTRTEGKGAAAIDAEEFGGFNVDSHFSNCISRKGRVGALFLSHSNRPGNITISGYFLKNQGEKTNDAHDILLFDFKLSNIDRWAFMRVNSMSHSPSIVENGDIHPDPTPIVYLDIIDDDDWLLKMKNRLHILLWSDFIELDYHQLSLQSDPSFYCDV